MMKMETTKRNYRIFGILIFLGIMLRYIVMLLGNNFDFESYCIVGEIAGNFRNVYAETERYNYAPIFFCIQGILYRISQMNPENWMLIYRILIVFVLTLADLGITFFIAYKYSLKKAIYFFLNPISIFITGYHNQFDNIAIFFALIAILFFNEEETFNRKDVGFVLFISLSLMIKHILFLLPVFLLLNKNLPFKKKILYGFIPPSFFVMSFIPFALDSRVAFEGILNNVFLYRSFNNSPFLSIFYKLIDFPSNYKIVVYGIMMSGVAFIVRKCKFDTVLMVYLITMVVFASAIANQYLVIPMAALCVLEVGIWDKVYMFVVSVFLILHNHGLGGLNIIQTNLSGSILEWGTSMFVRGGYIIATWILFFSIIALFRRRITKN